tara:strand:+ start:1095 stop:1796 length:702 start_codon:yes stop_codon:yes gene_type:complete
MSEKDKKKEFKKEDLKDPNKRGGKRPRIESGKPDTEITGKTTSDAMKKRVKNQTQKTMDAANKDFGDRGKSGKDEIARISKITKQDEKRDLDLIKQYGSDARKARSYRSSKFDGDMQTATDKAKTGAGSPNPQFFNKDKLKGGGKVKKGYMMGGKMKKGMASGGKFPDLTGDGKTTQADILKGRGVFAGGGKMKKGYAGGGKMKKGYANGGKAKAKVRGSGIAIRGVRPAKMR